MTSYQTDLREFASAAFGETPDDAHMAAVKSLSELAGLHLAMCLKNLEGTLPSRGVAYMEWIEEQIRATAQSAAVAGAVREVDFRHDPRGTTVKLHLSSGKANSLTGGWGVPADPDHVAALKAKGEIWRGWDAATAVAGGPEPNAQDEPESPAP